MKTPLEILLEKAKNGELILLPRFSFSDELSPGKIIAKPEFKELLLEWQPPLEESVKFSKVMDPESFEPFIYPCDNQTGGVVECVEPWFLDPVFEIIEIGPFGRPEHFAMSQTFEDAWEDNEGHIQVRETPVTDFNFVVTSGGLPIYFYAREGYWLGSEMIRRGATA